MQCALFRDSRLRGRPPPSSVSPFFFSGTSGRACHANARASLLLGVSLALATGYTNGSATRADRCSTAESINSSFERSNAHVPTQRSHKRALLQKDGILLQKFWTRFEAIEAESFADRLQKRSRRLSAAPNRAQFRPNDHEIDLSPQLHAHDSGADIDMVVARVNHHEFDLGQIIGGKEPALIYPMSPQAPHESLSTPRTNAFSSPPHAFCSDNHLHSSIQPSPAPTTARPH